MNLPGTHRDLGAVRARPLYRLMRALTQSAWDDNPLRQDRFAVHRRTRSVLFLWTAHEGWPDVQTVVLERYGAFESALLPIFRAASVRLNERHAVVNAMLAELPPGASIPAHVDTAPLFGAARRMHVPLQTNAEVTFTVDGEAIATPVGHLIEINNRRVHGVRNDGAMPRVHLIFDAVVVHH